MYLKLKIALEYHVIIAINQLVRVHLKDCQKKKEYLEKRSEEDVLDMSRLSSRNSDISVPSNLNISDVSVPMTSPESVIG